MTPLLECCPRFLQKSRVQIWLYEQPNLRLEGRIVVRGASACAHPSLGLFPRGRVLQQRASHVPLAPPGADWVPSAVQGFDEYMNLVLDDAEEVDSKKKSRRPIGTCVGACARVSAPRSEAIICFCRVM